MKRGSIFGPLLLIGLGALFLLKNLNPELRVFESVLEYWPFLLIGLGLFRLLEVLISYRSGTLATGRPGVSGGEWALVIIVTIIGASAWSVQRFTNFGPGRIKIGGVEMFGETFDYSVDATKAVTGKTPRIIVENWRGNCRIVGLDTSEVKISGRKIIKAMERASADTADKRTPIELTEAGDVVTVRTNLDRADGDRRVSGDFEISVPKGASIEARGRYGDFDISDILGEVVINSDNAGVRLQNLASNAKINLRRSDIIRAIGVKGNVEIKSSSGRDIELEDIEGEVIIDGSFSGETNVRNVAKPLRFESPVTTFRVEKLPGDLEITLASLTANNVIGPLRLTTKSKDVRVAEVQNAVEISVERGDVELRQSKLPLSRIDVQVKSGDIELALPEGARMNMNASTDRGGVNNDFSDSLREEEQGRGARLTGAIGSGPDVRVATSLGGITIRKLIAGERAQIEPPKPPKPLNPNIPPPPRAEN